MRLLFIARHHTYFRNYDLAIRDLAARGHTVHLAVEQEDQIGGTTAVDALVRECPQVTTGPVPPRRVDTWSGVARRLRLGLDYLRFLEPFYDGSPLRRTRARDRTPRLLIAWAEPPLVGGPTWRRLAGWVLHRIDAAVPPPESIVEYIRAQAPDAMLITPLVDLGSQQIDYLRAARQLGIPTGLAVWSWDHLTSKARLREYPDRVIVWNPTQREEAIGTHGVPPDRVVVTGAQCFDHWFGRVPARTREQFCRDVGLPADRPIVLWAGSGLAKGSPPEPPFVQEWLAWLRSSQDPVLASAGVLIRPHPSKAGREGWAGIDWSSYGPVVVAGGNPLEARSRSEYFDALSHSAAVIGVNTSVFLEAAIAGRDVLTVLVPRFHDTQRGTEHFRYLESIGGGLLQVAEDRERHLEQLGRALRRTASAEHPHRAFLEAFVRPHGLERPATPFFVQAVEDLGACRVAAPGGLGAARWRRAALGGAVRLVSRLAGEGAVRSPRELDPARQARIAAAIREQEQRKTG
jgi:hypothetical protein